MIDSSPAKQNYNAVDLIRLICAILVVAIHVAPFGTDSTGVLAGLNHFVQNYLARVAVPFFFIASGYFLFRKTDLTKFSVDCSVRYVKRMFRLYIIWTFLYLPFIVLKLRSEEDLGGALYNFIRQIIFDGSYTHLWYLTALIFSVILISYLLYKRVNPRVIVSVSALFYFIGLFTSSYFGFINQIKSSFPQLWNFGKGIYNFIITTRDGLFFGFFFVSIGMVFAFYDLKISVKKSAVCFCVSMVAMFAEMTVLQHYGYIYKCRAFVFLVPAVFFLFSFATNCQLSDKPCYLTFRKLSALIFYLHLWIRGVLSIVFKLIYKPALGGCILFVLTLIITTVFSIWNCQFKFSQKTHQQSYLTKKPEWSVA